MSGPKAAGRARGSARSALVPAAATAARRDSYTITEQEAGLNAEAIEVFAKAVGGRDALADTLAVAGPGGGDIARITALLLDPRYAHWGLPRLCSMVGLTVAELFAAYRKALLTRAHLQATHTIAAKLPAVVTDVMDKALPVPIPCEVCGGRGQTDQVPCWRCTGTGRVLSEPTVERHKLALELGQLLEKKGGLVVQQNNLAATVTATAPGSLEQLQQAVGDLLFGGSERGRAAGRASDVVAEAPPAELPDGRDDEPDLELPLADPPPDPAPAGGD